MNLLAVSRNGQGITTRLRRIRFQVGDVLFLQGALEGMPETLASLRCLPMGYRATGLDRSGQDYLPVMVLGVAMALVGLELMPVTAAFFGAAVFLVLFRMLSLK
jgi:hypothetical protein